MGPIQQHNTNQRRGEKSEEALVLRMQHSRGQELAGGGNGKAGHALLVHNLKGRRGGGGDLGG